MTLNNKKWLGLFALIFAGEIIFSLPFHIPRFFRPTFLEVFHLSHSDLGDIFAVYGITAMLAYFPSGIIADAFSARKLLFISLLATAAGGIYLAHATTLFELKIVFAYWGITTILLFWSAIIKATREWGDTGSQGRAFGFLDGGRGLVAVAVASVALVILSRMLAVDIHNVTSAVRLHAFKNIVYFYCAATSVAAFFIWFCITDPPKQTYSQQPPPLAKANFTATTSINLTAIDETKSKLVDVLIKPLVWLQAAIVICAYCGYKGLDYYSVYAFEVLGLDEVGAAQFSTYAAYLRPFAAISAGFIADRFSAGKVIIVGFTALTISYLMLATSNTSNFGFVMIYSNLIVTYCAVFAVRGVYFAMLEETKLSNQITGRAVGIISAIGFTPDIFFAFISGRILDASPGLSGYQHFFMFLTAIAIAGFLACFMLAKLVVATNKNHTT